MPKAFYLVVIATALFACRKDDPSKTPNTYWDYSGVYLTQVSGGSGDYGGSSAHSSSYDCDQVYEVSQVDDSIFFRGKAYAITEEGQLSFSNQSNNSSSTLTFSADLSTITATYDYSTDGAGNWSNNELTGTLTSFTAHSDSAPHPKKNEIDGNYVFTYSATEVNSGTTLVDTTYSDTAYLSIEPYSAYDYLVTIGSDSVLVRKFFSYYDYSFTSWYNNKGNDHNLGGGQLHLSGYSNSGSSGPHFSSNWSYSGYKL